MAGRRSLLDAHLVAAGLATLLLVGGLRAFFSTVYFSNLSSLGMNASAGLALLALTPLLYFLPGTASRGVVLAAALGLGAGRVAMGATFPGPAYLYAAALAVGGGMVLLPALAARGGARAGLGMALGLATDAALTFVARSADPTAGRAGLLVTVPAALALAALAWTPAPPRARPAPGTPWLAGAALGALLFLEVAVLASPHHLARWSARPVAPLAVASVLGLALPILLAARGRLPGPVGLTALNAGALAAVLDHVFFHSPLLPLLVFVGQAALALDAAMLAERLALATPARAGRAFALGALVVLAGHFLAAFGLAFAYVPLGSLWKGSERWLVPAAFLLASLAALAVARALPRPAVRATPLVLLLPVALVGAGLFAPAAPVDAPPAGEPVAVMAFNVHQGFSNAGVVDLAALERVLREESPDVVALQESDTPRVTSANVDAVAWLAARLGYHVAYGPPTSAQSFGVAVLSRLPIAEWHAVPLPSTKDNRYFVEARLDAGNGTAVWVYAVHLGLPAHDRMAENAILLERAASRTGPRILAGDFNSCPRMKCPSYEGPVDDVYEQVVRRFTDAAVAMGLPENDASLATYPEDGERIDYVFVSSDVRVEAHRVLTSDAARAASDHLPVIAVVRWNA